MEHLDDLAEAYVEARWNERQANSTASKEFFRGEAFGILKAAAIVLGTEYPVVTKLLRERAHI